MQAIRHGAWVARLAAGPGDRAAALALRGLAFRQGGADGDAWDDVASHVLVEGPAGLAATFRLRRCAGAGDLAASYTGARYDVSALAGLAPVVAELGRFCTDPACRDPDAIRLAWAAVTRLVDDWGAAFLIGCSSFPGTDPAPWAGPLGLLMQRHLAPPAWRPGPRAPDIAPLAHLPPPADPAAALVRMPPLLRSYLGLGGRVSDHAVIDRDLGTFHLFTGLSIAGIPPARARALRDLAR